MTLYDSFEEVLHDLYIYIIEHQDTSRVSEGSSDGDVYLTDGKYDIIWCQDNPKKIEVGLLGGKDVYYSFTEDGDTYKTTYKRSGIDIRKISYNTFKKHFRQAAISFEKTIQEDEAKLAQKYPYLH